MAWNAAGKIFLVFGKSVENKWVWSDEKTGIMREATNYNGTRILIIIGNIDSSTVEKFQDKKSETERGLIEREEARGAKGAEEDRYLSEVTPPKYSRRHS